MKKVIIILSLALLSLTTWAYDFQVDQLCYNIISENNVEVTWQQAPDHPNNIPAYPSLSEALTIPSTVIYNGITYTVTRIGYSAFADCTSLTSVTLPNSIKIIGEYAFSSCSSLTFVTIPNSITSIESGAFIFCSSLTTVTIPENVTSIGESAFSSCTSLTSVNLPNSITSIGDYAFSSCTSLTSVTLPNSIASIGSGAFFESSSLTTIYTETQTPPTLGSDCFYATNLNVIFVPSGTSSAYASAWGNDYLYIESGSEIKLTVYVATSGGLATAIAEKGYTLDQVNKLTVVGSLNDTDFGIIKNNMTSLIELNLEGIDNTTLPYEAFKNKNRLLNIVLPADLTIVPNNAFEGCSSLTSVTIPNSVTSIEVWAFGYCRSLTSITIPNSVTSIGEFAFESCSSLASVAIPNSVTSIGSFAFENCLSLSFITIPNTVTYIGNGAFSGCSSLTSITIPNNVTNIGSEVFRQCSSLSSATIGSGVESMDSYIFYDCSFLDTITCLGGNPPVMSEDFATINPSTCKLYVPQYALVDYLHAPVWSSFVNMYGIDVDYTLSVQMNEGGKIIYNNQEYIANTELTIDGGSQVTLQLVANTYNTIGYFRVNGVDYTSDIQGDGTITLPAVKQDANIEIFFAQSYLITFKDDDGTILQTSMVGYNNWPEYTGETPTKQGDEQYTYEFAGWSPELAPVTEEAVYTATYALYVRSYNISFVNYDGTILQSDYVEYGDMPYYYGWETPYKPATDEYYYEFIGWSPEITSVTGDATYTATFTEIKRTYNVYFYNGDYLLGMYELPYGETPAYTGETPTQPETQEYTYEFTGWSPELSPVTGEAYYYATFTEVRKQQHTIAYYYAGSAGYFANTCYTGQDFTVRILAHEGNTIQSVTLNGVDITSQLEADGTLTLYNITEDQTLVVSTRDIPSNISSSTPNHLRAWQANGTIFAEVDDNVATLQLYDVSGRLMNEYRHNGNYQVITLPAPNEVNILKVVGKDGSITAHKLM